MTDENNDKKIIEEVGSLPVNSRIFVNYKENPPKITFEYPDTNTNQITNSSSTYLFALIVTLILLTASMVGWTSYMHNTFFKDTYANDYQLISAKTTTYKLFNYSEILVDYRWNNKNYSTVIQFQKKGTFWYYPEFSQMYSDKNLLYDIIPAIVFYLLFFVFFIISVKLISLLFSKTKWGHNAFPRINKTLHNKKYSAEFTPQDVMINPITNKYTVELPMFNNMYLDYEATEDFSTYLEQISVVEHPFSKYVKKKGKEMKKKRFLLRKKERKLGPEFKQSEYDECYDKKKNIYLWKAVFEFKQKPTNGILKIWFTVWMYLLIGLFIVFLI